MKKLILYITLLTVSLNYAQIVNIPDTNFKNALLNHDPVIDTNSDGEIQITEAEVLTSSLYLDSNNIDDLTGIESFVNITSLNCYENNLTTLDLSNNIALTFIECSMNNISNLVLTNNTALTYLECMDNNLSTLDLTNNTLLTGLECSDNNLSILDFSNNIALRGCYCPNNQLTSINLSNNLAFFQLYCFNNQLTSIDISNCPDFDNIHCSDNPNLTHLNLKNGNNENFASYCHFENLPSLESVCVDEVGSDLTVFITDQVGHSITFTEDCSLSVHTNNLLNFSIFPVPAENILMIKSKIDIVKIEVYDNLGQLVLQNSMETKIDISNLTQGLYYVKVRDINGNSGVRKVLKNS